MNAPGIVIIGCGARKLDRPAPARSMYVGPYFRACLATAEAITDPGRAFILSARYGLLGLDDPIEPYDLTMGQPGSVSVGELAAQATERGITDEPVTALCGARYAMLIGRVWPRVSIPLAGLGIGRQRHVLAVMRSAPGL